MVQPKKGRRLGGGGAHQKAIIKNLAISLIENGKIETTTAKAKFLRMFVDKIITISKKGDLASRRRCMQLLGNYKAVQKLFNEIAPATYSRSSGFTRIVKLKNRVGDGAEIVQIEILK